MHASLLSDNQDMLQDPPQGSAAQSAAVTGTHFVTEVVASQEVAFSTNQAMTMTGMEHHIAPKDVSAVDHFLQSLGLSGGTSLAQTSVSNSLPSTLMSNTFEGERTIPPVPQEEIPYPTEETVREQPVVSNFGFTYTYQDGQSLPGLDLAVDQPEAPAPDTGFQNADEEDEYLYGSNVSGQIATEDKVEEYIPESKPPAEKVEKDEQLNKILSAIGFDFDMAKQIVEQTKRKEEQTKEQSQLKGLRKGKKEKSSLEPPQKKEESKPDSISEKLSAKGEETAKDETDEKKSTPVSAQPIPSIVSRVAQTPAKAKSSESTHTSSGNWSSHQYYGPTTSADYFSPNSAVPPTTATSTAIPLMDLLFPQWQVRMFSHPLYQPMDLQPLLLWYILPYHLTLLLVFPQVLHCHMDLRCRRTVQPYHPIACRTCHLIKAMLVFNQSHFLMTRVSNTGDSHHHMNKWDKLMHTTGDPCLQGTVLRDNTLIPDQALFLDHDLGHRIVGFLAQNLSLVLVPDHLCGQNGNLQEFRSASTQSIKKSE